MDFLYSFWLTKSELYIDLSDGKAVLFFKQSSFLVIVRFLPRKKPMYFRKTRDLIIFNFKDDYYYQKKTKKIREF